MRVAESILMEVLMKKVVIIIGVLAVLLWAGTAVGVPESSAEILDCG
jgi:hypothetical protein